MPRENYVAKQQRIGERLTRAMAKAHMDRRELAALTGYSEAQIVGWERGRAPLYPTELIKLCHKRVSPGTVAARLIDFHFGSKPGACSLSIRENR